jgi:putative ATPase
MSRANPSLFAETVARPLADRLRPQKLADVVGQDHILAPDAPIGRMVAGKRLSSLILWGPPGCGKTTIARLLADDVNLHFEPVSAVASGVGELRKIFEAAQERRNAGQGTLLFIDEIHRFNRAQQDVLLPYVEDGTVTLVGATTENPSFELNGALLSRCQVLVLNRLDDAALELLLQRAECTAKKTLPLDIDARRALKAMADGDGRYVLMMAEELFTLPSYAKATEGPGIKSAEASGVGGPSQPLLDTQKLAVFVQRRRPLYDKAQESHYNLISALHKSLRGSDCDAALYWFARMLAGGEEPRYIARRLTRFASEDIGLANPQALPMALAAWESYERLGSPEGELALAQLVIYLATAPKSNASYVAIGAAMRSAKENGSLMPPKHILNAPTKLMKDLGYSEGYEYDHESTEAFSGQNYFPDGMPRQSFYRPVERGFEREIKKRLDYWSELRRKLSEKP